MLSSFNQLIANFKALLSGGGEPQVIDVLSSTMTQEQKQASENMSFAIQNYRFDVVENLLKENVKINQTQLKDMFLANTNTGWLISDKYNDIKTHLAKNYEAELIEIFHDCITWNTGNGDYIQSVSSWAFNMLQNNMAVHVEEYLKTKPKEYDACCALITNFPNCFKGQIKPYYAYKEVLAQTDKDLRLGIVELKKSRYNANGAALAQVENNIYSKITKIQNLLTDNAELFNTPVVSVRVVLDQNGKLKKKIGNDRERALLSQKAVPNEQDVLAEQASTPATNEELKEKLNPIAALIKELPEKAQLEVKELLIMCEEIANGNQKSLTVEDRFNFNNTVNSNLPQALQDYISINPRYRSVLKTDAGKTVEDLLMESLLEMKKELGVILERGEKAKFIQLQSTHKYLTAKR